MQRLLIRVMAVAVTLAGGLIVGIGGAGAAGSALPVIHVKLTGKAITVGGALSSGAVDVQTQTSGEPKSNMGQGSPTFVLLNPGVTDSQLAAGLSHLKDPNDVAALGLGRIVFGQDTAPGTNDTETVLAAGKYLAVDANSNASAGKFPMTTFTVTKSGSPAALPSAAATQTAIDFAFRGSTTLKSGTLVRAVNSGYLVHMILLAGVKSKADGSKAIALLKAGKDNQAGKYMSNQFASLAGALGHGAVQQTMLKVKPGYYVEVCFMDTQDHREHTRLGMERLVHVVK